MVKVVIIIITSCMCGKCRVVIDDKLVTGEVMIGVDVYICLNDNSKS